MHWIVALLLIASSTRSVNAIAPYTRVLLPVYVENAEPGAYGSLWQTQFAVHNGSQIQYIIDSCTVVNSIASLGCQLILYPDEDLGPNDTFTVLPNRYPRPANGSAGAVLYFVPDLTEGQANPNDLSFELRIRDTSRSATNAGAEIPVVREAAFHTSTLHLLNIPLDPRFRLALRLFEMNLDEAEFTVRILDQETNAMISERNVTASTPQQEGRRLQPGFVEIRDLLPPAVSQPSALRIEIQPLTAGSAFWAYVGITNNDTQQVTLITPQ